MRSHHPRLALVALGLVLLLAAACDRSSDPTPPEDSVPVTVAQVIDGDTVELADGRRVRYLGINTPERDQPLYEEATAANRRLVEGQATRLALDVQTLDRYGRTLAYLWVDDQFVNVELVRQGYATAYTAPPNVRYSEVILAAQQAARAAQVGIWAPADLPLEIQRIVYDAPGSDIENPNGEWVEIVNTGSEAVDLAGLSLKDEANHIYTFPPLRLPPGQALNLYSGPGTDTGTSLFWGLVHDAVWNNDGDTAYLRDGQGRLIDVYGYVP
jgi:micrococcal nuclease